jgi:O-acetyl-ADP-ribose deacetylase (regulator of RNase III)
LKKDNLKSIAFPAIGSGVLNFPAETVARIMIETCSKFLKENDQYSIKIVIYENAFDMINVNKFH